MVSSFLSINGDHVPGEVVDNESTRLKNETYVVEVKAYRNKTRIDVPATISCVLEIPSTEYVRERTETYNGEMELLSYLIPCDP